MHFTGGLNTIALSIRQATQSVANHCQHSMHPNTLLHDQSSLLHQGGSMPQLAELIVYLWLVPAVLQLTLPLAALVIWLALRVPAQLLGRKSAADEAHTATA